MSFPLITCPLCGSQVSKRSTILVEPYGRICRNHPEVEQHKDKLAQLAAKATEDKKLEKAMQNLQVMMIVEQFRMLAHMSGQSLELTLLAFLLKVPQSIRGEVENQVRERGPITQKEAEDAACMAAMANEVGVCLK